MRRIVYYVASSIDGFICGPGQDISGFVGAGSGVARYLDDLASFDTVIMGRHTYEFGYKFGLKPGQPAYPHMQHYLFSNTLQFKEQHPQVDIKKIDLREIESLKQQPGPDIYLCGGGQFAGWLLDHHQVDVLKIKLNPLIQGQGVRIFGDSTTAYKLALQDTAEYEHGLQIMTYSIIY